MQYRRLGESALQVSAITMGCWAIGDERFWGAQEKSDSISTLHAAVENGINFFDTAESYGHGYSEELIGEAFSDMRDQVVIASKVGVTHLAPADLKTACENSLKRLRTEYIDLYSIHWPNRQVPIEETLRVMEDLRRDGKIRFMGVSNFGQRDLTELICHGRVEVDQLPYSLLWRAIEFEVLPVCIRNHVSVSCYSPLLEGLLTGKFENAEAVPVERARTRHFSSLRPLAKHGEPGFERETFATIGRISELSKQAGIPMAQAALAWLLKQPAVATVIVGARSPEQIVANAQAGTLDMSDSIVAALAQATESLRDNLGPRADPWQSESRIQ